MNESQSPLSSRREFLKTSGALAAAGALAAPLFFTPNARAAAGDPIKVGLIGCGGRGSGAARQALGADPGVVITALGDAFPEPLQSSLKNLQADKTVGPRVKVTPETSFIGLDAYQKVIASGVDVVLLATPPGFRRNEED